jgi:hypothetical protein
MYYSAYISVTLSQVCHDVHATMWVPSHLELVRIRLDTIRDFRSKVIAHEERITLLRWESRGETRLNGEVLVARRVCDLRSSNGDCFHHLLVFLEIEIAFCYVLLTYQLYYCEPMMPTLYNLSREPQAL